MVPRLTDLLAERGRALPAVTDWIAAYLAQQWEEAWQRQHAKLQRLFDTIGEPAYGHYNRELFRPVQGALEAEGLTCRPRLPGNLDLSEEHWGPEHHRERRMWALLVDEGTGGELGAVVTRFFHDHTRLRLPAPPTVVGLAETDHDVIRTAVLDDKGWGHPG